MSEKILVTGSTGFIGSEVCRIAAEQGHDVIGIARSGKPDKDAPWVDKVTWVKANVLQPETWREHLQGCHAVIHCVGITSEDKSEGRTFERLNGDAAEVAIWEAEQADVERFVFLSAQETPPFVSSRYLAAKRQAEAALHRSKLHSIVLRPMFVYGPTRPATFAVNAVLETAEKIPGLHQPIHEKRALRVEKVAAVAVKAATDLDYEGVITLDNIEYVAGSDWESHRQDGVALPDLRPLLMGAAAFGLICGALWTALARQD